MRCHPIGRRRPACAADSTVGAGTIAQCLRSECTDKARPTFATCDAQDFYRQAGKCVERCSDETAFSIMVALQLLVILALLFVQTTLHKPTPTSGPEAARAPELQLSQLEADDAGDGKGGQ